jgi:hypothetical protein
LYQTVFAESCDDISAIKVEVKVEAKVKVEVEVEGFYNRP